MWIVVDDSKRGQPCGNGGVRKWISAYTIYDQYLQVIGQPDKRDIPEGQGLMEPGEKYNQWNLDQWTNHTTNVDLPPIGAVPVPSGFWDMPGLLHVPGHPTGLPPGLMFVYKRYYAIAIICVCEPLKEMLTDPLSVLGYSLIDIRKTPVGGVQTAEVSVRVGNYGPSSWGNLKKPDGTRHGLTPVDSFTNNCC
jgi:hypothetical protein